MPRLRFGLVWSVRNAGWCSPGAGILPGVVYGRSDQSAAYPTADPHPPADFAATLYHLLGVPPDQLIHDPTGRPHQVVAGRVIEGVVGSI